MLVRIVYVSDVMSVSLRSLLFPLSLRSCCAPFLLFSCTTLPNPSTIAVSHLRQIASGR